MHDGILRNYNPWEFHREKSTVEDHIDKGDEDKGDAEECIDPEELGEAIDETFSMLHDMTNTRAFSIMSEFERLRGPNISESPELLEKFGRLVRDIAKELFPSL